MGRALAISVLLVLGLAAPSTAGSRSARIVNGLFTQAYPEAGALLFGGNPDSAVLSCSGAMIGCDTFLTAAHCVCSFTGASCQPGQVGDPNPADHLVFLQSSGFHAIASISVHPAFDFPDNDLAVIKLAVPVTGVPPVELPSAKPPVGTAGTLVGFGKSGGAAEDYGLKRQGAVETVSCSGGISNTFSICWDYTAPIGPPGDDSNTCNGDSGGPLYVDEAGTRVVAGVTSGGLSADCLEPDASYDTNVHNYLSWIQIEAGADLANTTCGTISQVGDSNTTVFGFSGQLTGPGDEGRHSFTVPAGMAELRITMNADETPPNDFDLFVKFGAPPTTSDYDCIAFGANNWGQCDWNVPSPGTWHVMVNAFNGAGAYQATATLFDADPGTQPPPPLPEGAQDVAQRKCLENLAKGGRKVAKSQGKDAVACLAAYARGRTEKLGLPGQTQTAQACLGNDLKSRVLKAATKTLLKDAKKCLARPDQMPDYAYLGGDAVNAAATDERVGLSSDVFGPDLDAALATDAVDAAGADCQSDVSRAATKVHDAAVKVAFKAEKQGLAGAGGLPVVTSAAELATALENALAADTRGKIAKAKAKLLSRVAKRCTATGGSLASLFPGCAPADVNALAACAGASAVCRACRTVETSDGLDLDCDLLDDGLVNTSCP